MLFERRRLRPGELDAELIWLCVTVAGAGAAILWRALHLPWPVCTFRTLTGLPCLTCGATRSAVALLHGEIGMAWRFNPLALSAICAVVLFDLYAIVLLSTGARRLRLRDPKRNFRVALCFVGSIAALNWIYLLRQ